MNTYTYIISNIPVKVWGLTPAERLKKTLKSLKNITIIEDLNKLNENDEIVLLKGNYIYDDRVLRALIDKKDSCLKINEKGKEVIVAIHTTTKNAQYAYDILVGKASFLDIEQLDIDAYTIAEICTSYFHTKLRKVDVPYVLPVDENNKEFIENKLFASSYKGVTDIVTRLVWPPIAKVATKFCVNFHITPNEVTFISLILAIIVGILFIKHYFWTGLILGWIMTFLDTLDGKLARVTISSSKFGDILDHGLDIFHPPYWYITWCIGIHKPTDMSNTAISITITSILVFYFLGRILEGSFRTLTDKFSIFCWRSFDSYFRLIIARRNPNLIILTVSLIFNKPDIGIMLVACWTILSSFILLFRLLKAFYVKKKNGYLTSWLEEIDQYTEKHTLAEKLFIYK